MYLSGVFISFIYFSVKTGAMSREETPSARRLRVVPASCSGMKLLQDGEGAGSLRNVHPWFQHFYQFGVVIFTFITVFMVRSYVFGLPLPGTIIKVVDFFEPRPAMTVSATSILLVQVLETCHVYRRCYECMCVSVYSNVRMHVWHYLMGYFFYFGVQLTILANAPTTSDLYGTWTGFKLLKCFGQLRSTKKMSYVLNCENYLSRGFQSGHSNESAMPRFSVLDISAHHIIGTVIFLWAFCVQFDSHLRMASLRKDHKGNVVTLNHKIPQGGMFAYVSCPHYMAELAIYCALSLVLGQPNTTWWLMMAWNWSNQVAISFFSHNWYRQNFPSYPKHRKAIIPFVL
ncbi:polyprenal reductase isoform X2 [Dermacentor variabilis]|uniref:polyprenal reductase isoform X2 n=1 Tax=Dermacentor variabilis TaxID=34621 RepID=UPI003F5C3280